MDPTGKLTFDNADVFMQERAVFPITITVGDSKIELLGDGTYRGDEKKMLESISTLKSYSGSEFALQIWLLAALLKRPTHEPT